MMKSNFKMIKISKKDYKKYFSPFKKILNLTSDIYQKLPLKEDSKFNRIVKYCSVVDTIISKLFLEDENKFLSSFYEEQKEYLGLERINNKKIVEIFSVKEIQGHFESKIIKINDYTNVICYRIKENQLIYLIVTTYCGRENFYDYFWCTPNFDFKIITDVLWSKHQNKMHIGLSRNNDKDLISNYSTIPEVEELRIFLDQTNINVFRQKHLKYKTDGVSRIYLFNGSPGTGKSTFALSLASPEEKILRIDASGITDVGIYDLDLIVQNLSPDFLIVDDIDRAVDLTKSLPVLFTLLSDFKVKHPKCAIILTINDLKLLDKALRRPGRIDEIIDFNNPDSEERLRILTEYSKFYNLSDVDLLPLKEATAGLTAPFLKEIIIQLKYSSMTDVLNLIQKMNK